MESPPKSGNVWFFSTRSSVIAWSQNLYNGCFFAPKSSRYAKGISGGLSVLEFRTQSWNEQAQMEPGWELPMIFDFAAQIRVRIFLKDGAFFPVKKIHAKSTPPKNLKSTPILKQLPVVSLGARPCASLLLDASVSMLINQKL